MHFGAVFMPIMDKSSQFASFETLKGGFNQEGFRQRSFCAVHNDKIPSVCDNTITCQVIHYWESARLGQ
jgi:hypothetical protein